MIDAEVEYSKKPLEDAVEKEGDSNEKEPQIAALSFCEKPRDN
jgi:hypothetical protein